MLNLTIYRYSCATCATAKLLVACATPLLHNYRNRGEAADTCVLWDAATYSILSD